MIIPGQFGFNVSHVFNSKLYLSEKKYACSGISAFACSFYNQTYEAMSRFL